ncbi:MAG: type II secretion system protein GspM [Desulfotignum sp.]|nr:type II secretion system protein GspM [Desulfotignum sp.]
MNRLSTREKQMIALGGLLVIVFVSVQFVFLPLLDQKKELTRVLAIEQDAVAQMTRLQAQYMALSRDMDTGQSIMASRPRDFTLFSFLDTQAEKSGVKKNIDYMRPFSQNLDDSPYVVSKVRLKLKNMYLNDFIRFLNAVETSGNGVYVISLSLSKTGEKENLLEAVLEAQTLMNKEPN